MTPRAPGSSDQALLLEQVSWIRRLARELVADRDLAEDLVQETCVVALERSPQESGRLRAWLAEVLRNALRQHARSEGRRAAREALAARGEALEPTDQLVERVLLQRELVNAVLELDEPYRSTLLLRFFDELPPREIARRTGTPLATVNSRLQRALARLRERLDGRHQAWAALFLPWVQRIDSIGPPTLFTLLMKTKLTLAAAAAAIAAGAIVWWSATPSAERVRGAEDSPRAAALAPRPHARGTSVEETPSAREPAPASLERARTMESATPPATALAPWTVRLRVLDAEGLPVAGIAVCADGSDEVLGTSGPGGWCVFDARAERLALSAADPRWVTILAGSPSRSSSVDPVLVLAPAVEFAGSVCDESGRALANASVSLELPDGFRTRFSELLEATRSSGWRSATGADGRFRFERVPAVAGATVGAVAPGYERAQIEAPLAPARDLELVLVRPRMPLSGVLRGRVVDQRGAAVDGARVGLGLASVVSDERGEFELALARAVTSELLTAVKAGHRPARMERPGEPGPGRSGWPDDVTLVLSGPALSIRGVVLVHESSPVSGARVWIHDPTQGAPIGMLPSFLEPLMAGAPIPPGALESEAQLPEEDGDHFYDWYTNAREPSALWHWVVSDGAGRFELPGLDDRRYRLDVLRPASLEVVTSESLPAGESSAVIRLGPPDVFERVEGRVLSEDGHALAGIEVSLYRPMIDARARIFGGNSQLVMVQYAGRVTSDAEGRFLFEGVPRTGAQVSVRGDGIVPAKADVAAAALDIRVETRCHFEVVLRESDGRFDAISMADAEGRGLDLLVLSEGSVNAWTSVALVGGRSGVVSVSSHARQLRLLEDGAVVETLEVDLVPGDVNRIEL
jgi:RNA polymerase sigma-70 factor (ECF subfamily)